MLVERRSQDWLRNQWHRERGGGYLGTRRKTENSGVVDGLLGSCGYFDKRNNSVINGESFIHGAAMFNRFQTSAILILSALVWGAVLWFSGVELSWAHAQPYGITAFVVTALVVVFEKHLWHWRIFRGWLARTPHIDGEWDVVLVSTYVDPATKKPIEPIHGTMIATQTLGSLVVRLETQKQSSHTIGYDIIELGDGNYEVLGVYQSDPAIEHRLASPIHYGTFKLRLQTVPDEKLVGHYWTDRSTSGNFQAKNRRAHPRGRSAK